MRSTRRGERSSQRQQSQIPEIHVQPDLSATRSVIHSSHAVERCSKPGPVPRRHTIRLHTNLQSGHVRRREGGHQFRSLVEDATTVQRMLTRHKLSTHGSALRNHRSESYDVIWFGVPLSCSLQTNFQYCGLEMQHFWISLFDRHANRPA